MCYIDVLLTYLLIALYFSDVTRCDKPAAVGLHPLYFMCH